MKKKLLLLAMSSILVFSLLGCGSTEEVDTTEDDKETTEEVAEVDETEETEETEQADETSNGKDITLEDVNEFLNTSADLGPGTVVNPVAVIPMKHIDGPKNNIDVYAFVNFQYEGRDFVKYQVSYISCTCRPAAVNYWNTAYMELSLPSSKDPNDVVLKYLSFDDDPNGDYQAGLWGDSSPVPSGITYESLKEEYIPYFNGKDIAYLQGLDTVEDIDKADYQTGEGRESYDADALTGATVSTNNIIRIINAMLDYHTQNEFFE